MKKYILVPVLLALIIPSAAFASWWNPFTWKIFHREQGTTELPTPISESPDISTSTTSPQIIREAYSVVKVVDGDTIDVSIGSKIERLRLIGINTPETVDPRKQVECFGVEASNKAKTMLTGKKVYLESDSTQGERDKYNRLLRYVFLEDGTNFNLLMIRQGYAYEYTYALPYKYQAEFKLAQKSAETNKMGLWASGVCDKAIAPTPIVAPAPISVPTPPATAPKPTQQTTQCNPNYSGCLKQNAGDYDCSGGSGDGPNYTGAVQILGYDEYKLDRDGDGWGCESN